MKAMERLKPKRSHKNKQETWRYALMGAVGLAAGVLATGAMLYRRHRTSRGEQMQTAEFSWQAAEHVDLQLPEELATFPAQLGTENRAEGNCVAVIATNPQEKDAPVQPRPGQRVVVIRSGVESWRIGVPKDPATAFGRGGEDSRQAAIALPLDEQSLQAAFGYLHDGTFTGEATNAVERLATADLGKYYPGVPLANLD